MNCDAFITYFWTLTMEAWCTRPYPRQGSCHAGPPPGPPMPAQPRQTGHSPRPCPLLTALIGAGTRARALAAVEWA